VLDTWIGIRDSRSGARVWLRSRLSTGPWPVGCDVVGLAAGACWLISGRMGTSGTAA
jgi:hypothetical protein